MIARCEYCYHERETRTINVATMHGFREARICAGCERRYTVIQPRASEKPKGRRRRT